VLLLPVPDNADPAASLRPAPQDIKVLSRATIRKGDSLWRISKRVFGRGAYYPQLLAFNAIENPDRIYEGESLLLPTGTLAHHPELAARLAGKTATVVFPSPPAPAGAASAVSPPVRVGRETAPRTKEVRGKTAAASARADNGEETEARTILSWADQGKCENVIAAAERFVSRHPDSAHLAAVLWHQAECHRSLGHLGQ
jgi:LysM repeat protein